MPGLDFTRDPRAGGMLAPADTFDFTTEDGADRSTGNLADWQANYGRSSSDDGGYVINWLAEDHVEPSDGRGDSEDTALGGPDTTPEPANIGLLLPAYDDGWLLPY